MGWLLGLMRNHWLMLCLGCAGWFVVHTWVLMFNDVRLQRRKLALRRRAQDRRLSAADAGAAPQLDSSRV